MAKPLTPQPISSIGTWDNVRFVDSIIHEAESGIFLASALLIDQILRDDRIHSVVMTRVLGLLGRELDFDPSKDTAQGRRIAEEIEQDWPAMFSHSSLMELLLWGLLQGAGYGQVIEEGDTWRLEVWHPHSLRWDEYTREYRVQAREQAEFPLIPEDGGYVDAEGRRWVLFTPYGFGNSGRRGLVRNLAHLYLERQWALRDRARYSEIHGQPVRFGIGAEGSSDAELSKFEDELGHIGAESVVIGRAGWDLKLVEAVGKSHELFEGEITQLDKAIATLVLGQSQSVDGQAGLGSNDKAGELVRIDIMRADADALPDCLRAQFLVPYCQFAYGSGDMAPWPCWQVDPPEDKAARAKVHLDQANADSAYIDHGVLTAEEVALSRFGSGDYSLETEIDTDAREAIKNIGAEQMKIDAQKALDQAKNPQPPPQANQQPVPNGANGKQPPLPA